MTRCDGGHSVDPCFPSVTLVTCSGFYVRDGDARRPLTIRLLEEVTKDDASGVPPQAFHKFNSGYRPKSRLIRLPFADEVPIFLSNARRTRADLFRRRWLLGPLVRRTFPPLVT